MKFTLSWLKDHLQTDADLATICDRLTMIGLEVEAIDDRAAFRPFTIAKVITAERHPDADKLQVLSVDAGGGETLQVVCGAPNARAGLVGVLARPGSYIPGLDTTIGKGNIRGVESFGMMCSERELKLSDEHDGIIDLPADAPVGESYAEWAGMADPVIEINLTPNRPDCTGVFGIARDLAAAGLGTLKTADVPSIAGEGPCPTGVTIEASDLSPGFALRLVRGVRNGASPGWMQRRLNAIGLRPINALVDITNYVTFDRGRPLHVFDAAKVKGDLTIRRAKNGETIEALDERTYELNDSMCVIADENGVESLAGVMGGEASGCDENTTDVLVESALWDPANIARTGRDLGIITDARYRFERGVDPAFMEPGLDLATRLITDICGGQPSEKIVAGYDEPERKRISFPPSEVKRLTGIDVPKAESLSTLSRLGFDNDGEEDGAATITVPTWRPDIDGKADLVEEVIRIHGVDEIGPAPLPAHGEVGGPILTPLQNRTRAAKRALAARGMMEAVTWSFIPSDHAELFGGGDERLKLANPIAADMSDMRPSLLPGLLAAAGRNAKRGYGDVALFEVSGTYEDDTPKGQRRVAGGVRTGSAHMGGSGRHWSGAMAPVGVFDAKSDAIAVLEAIGAPVDKLMVMKGAADWYHPGRSGTLRLGPKNILASFGEFHPRVLDALDVAGPVCGFEVYVDALPAPKKKATRTKPKLELSPFQAVSRDFAFIVDKDVPAGEIVKATAAADRGMISDVAVFDVFEGESVGEGKKSIAVAVTIQPLERTLTDEDFDTLSSTIIANVAKQTGGVLRG